MAGFYNWVLAKFIKVEKSGKTAKMKCKMNYFNYSDGRFDEN